MEQIILNLQEGLADLTKALSNLTITITLYRGEIDKSIALLQSDHAHMRDKWSKYATFLDGNGESAPTRLKIIENALKTQQQSHIQLRGAMIAAALSLVVSALTWVLRGK